MVEEHWEGTQCVVGRQSGESVGAYQKQDTSCFYRAAGEVPSVLKSLTECMRYHRPEFPVFESGYRQPRLRRLAALL